MKSSYNFILSLDGNYPELSHKESRNVLSELIKDKLTIQHLMSELLVITLNKDYFDLINTFQKYSRLISLTKSIELVLHKLKIQKHHSLSKITKKISDEVIISKYHIKIPDNLSFRIDIVKKGEFNQDNIFNSKNRIILKYKIADLFIKKFKFKVNLNNPDIIIQVILTSQLLIIGLHLFDPNRKAIINRAPSHRSYFHPASMSPLLVRSMLNLSLISSKIPITNRRQHNNDIIFLDPFMGGGGMLIEASDQGFYTIGLEIGYWECRGARMNLSSLQEIKNGKWTIIRSNSTKIPLKSESIDVIVSDPPYGQSTLLGGFKIDDLIQKVINECYRVLKFNSKMVISIPSHVKVVFNEFEIIDQIPNKVHQSLTRNIFILRKV